MKKYSAVSALSNKSYLELLQFCACTSATASVIVQEPLGREPTLNQFLEHIVPVLISKDVVTEWPGTQLIQGTAEMYKFSVNDYSIQVLMSAANNLADWQQPRLPEDICFYREDKSILFESIVHECDCRLILTDAEFERLPNLLRQVFVVGPE